LPSFGGVGFIVLSLLLNKILINKKVRHVIFLAIGLFSAEFIYLMHNWLFALGSTSQGMLPIYWEV
jgi:hypothetical protein